VMGSLFVVGISAYYILKNKDVIKAKKSIVVGSTFGLITSIFLILSGDESAHQVAQHQPMKLAAMEGLYDGHARASIVSIGQLTADKVVGDDKEEFVWSLEVPYALSLLGFHDIDAYVPGIDQLVYGDKEAGIESVADKITKGKIAIAALRSYKDAKKVNDILGAEEHLKTFRENEKYFGYGYLKDEKDVVPNVPLVFYSFHIMVGLGTWFFVLFFLVLYFSMVNKIEKKRVLLYSALWSIPLGYLAGEMGWVVAESGRQPWAIQDMLPVGMATSHISTSAVQITFWMFAIIFTFLLIAEIKIMFTQVKKGMEEH